MVEHLGKKDAIDDESDVVAHEHGTDKRVWVSIEESDSLLGNAILLAFHLCPHAVTGHESYLHAREEGRENHCHHQPNDLWCEFRELFYHGVSVGLGEAACRTAGWRVGNAGCDVVSVGSCLSSPVMSSGRNEPFELVMR